MDRIIYDRMAELDTRHWWYRARRDVLAALIRRRIAPPSGGRVLDLEAPASRAERPVDQAVSGRAGFVSCNKRTASSPAALAISLR